MEQTAAHEALKSMIAAGSATSAAAGPVDPANVGKLREVWNAGAGNGGGEAWRARISSFFCPSDSGRSVQPPEAPGPTNLRVSTGELAYRGGSAVGEHYTHRGLFGGGQDGAVTNGVVAAALVTYAGRRVGLETIQDGTSNTIMISERLIGGADDTNSKIGAGLQSGVFDGTGDTANLTNPRECLNLPVNRQIPTNKICTAFRPTGRGYSYATNGSGVAWGDGAPWSISFQTILPPNAPACTTSQSNVINSRALIPPTSSHTGGVNAVAADASGRFITDSVDTGDLTTARLPAVTGSSPYGVWGAYGTTRGGESKGLP